MFTAVTNSVVRTWSTLADSNRSRVLSLYRRILRLAQHWSSADGDPVKTAQERDRRILRLAQHWSSADGDPVKTAQERDYIRDEARRLFRRNAQVTDPVEIAMRHVVSFGAMLRSPTLWRLIRTIWLCQPLPCLYIFQAHILEAESRIELALHYKTPYPRLSNLPQSTLAGGTSATRAFRRTRRLIDESVPAYLKSYTQAEPKKPVASSSSLSSDSKKTAPLKK
ncbi:unnamed protein product [Schistocephalus solidus]|uniref:Complex1_LYR_dom domain-containing protein n=1 Tax=Schistocephalus solidus TaxID=70667 RepID=A0A183TBC0_SCHSO|nr:unnamed protein product [Schistocephalus solidus]